MITSIYYIAFLKLPTLYNQRTPTTTQLNTVSVFEITHFLPTFINIVSVFEIIHKSYTQSSINMDIMDTIKKAYKFNTKRKGISQ